MEWRALWRKRATWYFAAFALQLLVAPLLLHDWDGYVFLQSASDLARGVTPYQVAQAAPTHIFLEDSWPPVNSWYAYPPLPLLLFAPLVILAQAAHAAPWLLRVALKLPFIAGDLGLAFVGGLLVAKLGFPEKRGLAEKMLLFNPFLIFIAAGWGMFDAIMMALVLLGVLALAHERHALAGVAWGAAALVKLWPVLLFPVALGFVWRRRGALAAARMTGAALVVGVLVCAPFFALAPRGFLEQTILMHTQRPPAGFALVSFPLQLRNVNNLFGLQIPLAPVAVVDAVASGLLLVALGVAMAAGAKAKDARGLLRALLGAVLLLLLVNKVVNEQYFVMPISLLALEVAIVMPAAKLATPQRRDKRGVRGAQPPDVVDARVAPAQGANTTTWYRLAYGAYTWGGLASSLLIGLHFVTMVPADVAARVGIPRPDEMVAGIAAATGLSVLTVFSLPHALAIVLLVPALVASIALAAPLVAGVVRWPSARWGGAAVALLLLAPPVAGAVLSLPEPAAPPHDATLPALWVRVDLAVWNPSHDPAVRDGSWTRVDVAQPAEGWYSETPGKLRADLAAIKAMGATGVVATADAGNRVTYETFLAAARDAGLGAAPAIDADLLGACTAAHRLSPTPPERAPASAQPQITGACARDALVAFRDDPGALRLDGKPVLVLLHGANLTDPQDLPRDASIVEPGHDGIRMLSWNEYREPDPLEARQHKA